MRRRPKSHLPDSVEREKVIGKLKEAKNANFEKETFEDV